MTLISNKCAHILTLSGGEEINCKIISSKSYARQIKKNDDVSLSVHT